MRTLATGKWVALTLGGVLVIVAFGALSWWQWQRAQRDQLQTSVVPYSDVLGAGRTLSSDEYGARVTITGAYDLDHQALVKHGRGFWVVTPLRSTSGDTVAIARADVTAVDSAAVADVTPGTVTVVGYAQPFEGDPGTPSTLPAGQTDRLTESGLALPYDVVDGWIALTEQSPAPAVAAPQVPPAVGGASPAPLRLQNLSYAAQWLLFAGFVIFFWVRLLRDDVREGAEAAPQPATTPVREVY
jgi:cytochrome oxidase assembly protein ShyY1